MAMDAPRFDRRQEVNIERWATSVFLLLNIAGIVWASATISASVDELRRTVAPLAVQAAQNANDIAVLKDRSNRGKDAGK